VEQLGVIYRREKWWAEINWAAMERSVRQMQSRIFKATRDGDGKRAKHLMKLLARSESAKLLAIYIITQKNSGKVTPGIDGKIYLNAEDRMELSKESFDYRIWKFQPALRRYIPKPKDPRAPKDTPVKLRPLSIMTIKDRVMTTMIAFALNAQWEALLEPNVFGYRPGRCTQDAIQVLFKRLDRRNLIILDGDIRSFFDNVRHDAILPRITCFGTFIRRVLNLGIVEKGCLKRPTTGIMQGNPLSPILANIALHGLETEVEQEYGVFVIRYADDLVVLAPTIGIMESRVIPRLNAFLAKRGLELKEEKTRIVTRREGFNFLGFTIKEPRLKLYVIPQKEKIHQFLDNVRAIITQSGKDKQRSLIARLNLVINGWTSYYRYSDAEAAFTRVDDALWHALWRWAKRRHPNKGHRWIAAKYFGKSGDRAWAFRDPDTGYALATARSMKRQRYTFVVGYWSPFDKSPEAIKIGKRRRYDELRYVIEHSANGMAGLPDGCDPLLGR